MSCIFKGCSKKIISLLLVVVSIFSLTALSGCTEKEPEAVLSLNDVKISNDVFVYFLDLTIAELGTKASPTVLKEKAIEKVATYFKTNSLANAHGITLSIAEKTSVSEKVNGYWSTYDSYYEKIGVTKETLTKVFTADAFREKLTLTYFGTNGTEEIPLARIYAYFLSNYVLFQSITGYFTETDVAGETIRLPQNEIEALVIRFQSMADVVNSGEKTMEEAADYLAEAGMQSSVQTVILHKDDTSYPEGFFDKIQSIDSRYAAIIASNDYIFLVVKAEADVNSTFFKSKKTEIIQILAGDGIDPIIEGAYKTESKVSSVAYNDYLQLVLNAKGE